MRCVAILLLAAALGGCEAGRLDAPVTAGDLPPLRAGHRARVAEWARGFYADPAALRGASVSDPVAVRDPSGRLLWLVCVEPSGAAVPAGRQALGFAGDLVTVPLARARSTLSRDDCDRRPLTWRRVPDLGRS